MARTKNPSAMEDIMAQQHATQQNNDDQNTPQEGLLATSAGDRGALLPLPGEEGPAIYPIGDTEPSTMSTRYGQSDPKREGRREANELSWKYGDDW